MKFISKSASWLEILSFIKFPQVDIVFFNIFMICFYAVAFLLQYLHHRNMDKKYINKAYIVSGFKVYLQIIRNLLQGFLMIFVPFALGIIGVIYFMDQNETFFIGTFLANYDDNIANITAANKKRYNSSRVGTVVLTVAIYLALTIISLNFQAKSDGNDFINDENLELIEKQA